MNGMTVRLIDDASEFLTLRDRWNDLLRSSRSDNPFLTWEWLHAWWTQFGIAQHLRLIVVQRGDTIVAIAPLHLVASPLYWFSRLEFLGTAPEADAELAELGGFYWDLGRPYFLEIGAIGSTLELRIWPVEDGAEARPRQAMLTARDTDNPAGLIALLSRSYGPFELKEATFDDVTFQPMSLAGDMNGDDVVDGVDLSLLGRSLGACEDAANCPGDLDHDGDVSAQDLEAAADIAHCHMALRGHL